MKKVYAKHQNFLTKIRFTIFRQLFLRTDVSRKKITRNAKILFQNSFSCNSDQKKFSRRRGGAQQYFKYRYSDRNRLIYLVIAVASLDRAKAASIYAQQQSAAYSGFDAGAAAAASGGVDSDHSDTDYTVARKKLKS